MVEISNNKEKHTLLDENSSTQEIFTVTNPHIINTRMTYDIKG